MPEINFCLFDLNYLFKLFPKADGEFMDNFARFEQATEEQMAENRYKLFEEYDYCGEF